MCCCVRVCVCLQKNNNKKNIHNTNIEKMSSHTETRSAYEYLEIYHEFLEQLGIYYEENIVEWMENPPKPGNVILETKMRCWIDISIKLTHIAFRLQIIQHMRLPQQFSGRENTLFYKNQTFVSMLMYSSIGDTNEDKGGFDLLVWNDKTSATDLPFCTSFTTEISTCLKAYILYFRHQTPEAQQSAFVFCRPNGGVINRKDWNQHIKAFIQTELRIDLSKCPSQRYLRIIGEAAHVIQSKFDLDKMRLLGTLSRHRPHVMQTHYFPWSTYNIMQNLPAPEIKHMQFKAVLSSSALIRINAAIHKLFAWPSWFCTVEPFIESYYHTMRKNIPNMEIILNRKPFVVHGTERTMSQTFIMTGKDKHCTKNNVVWTVNTLGCQQHKQQKLDFKLFAWMSSPDFYLVYKVFWSMSLYPFLYFAYKRYAKFNRSSVHTIVVR